MYLIFEIFSKNMKNSILLKTKIRLYFQCSIYFSSKQGHDTEETLELFRKTYFTFRLSVNCVYTQKFQNATTIPYWIFKLVSYRAHLQLCEKIINPKCQTLTCSAMIEKFGFGCISVFVFRRVGVTALALGPPLALGTAQADLVFTHFRT